MPRKSNIPECEARIDGTTESVGVFLNQYIDSQRGFNPEKGGYLTHFNQEIGCVVFESLRKVPSDTLAQMMAQCAYVLAERAEGECPTRGSKKESCSSDVSAGMLSVMISALPGFRKFAARRIQSAKMRAAAADLGVAVETYMANNRIEEMPNPFAVRGKGTVESKPNETAVGAD